MELSYKVNSSLYNEINKNHILSILCKVVDDLNYYIFRSVRDKDIVLERTSEKVKGFYLLYKFRIILKIEGYLQRFTNSL